MKKTLLLLAVVLMGLGMMAQTTTYTKVTSIDQLSAGDKVLLVGEAEGTTYVMSWQKSNNRGAVTVTNEGGSITTSVANDPTSQTEPFEFTFGGQDGAWTFFDEVTNGYLYAPGGSGSGSHNYLRTQAELTAQGQWTITFAADGACVPVSNGGAEERFMRYNATSTLFSCYKETSNQSLVYIYKGGDPVIDPEPSNYPTNLNANLNLTRIDLTWTASTGAQLPRGYVVIGSIDDINPPVDGEVVPNNLDPSAGIVTFNTTGTSASFDCFPPQTTWTFAVFPYTNSGDNIDYKNDEPYPAVDISTEDVTCVFASDFANGLEPFLTFDIEGDQTWIASSYDGIPFAKMSGYTSSKVYHANEDWLITPNVLANGSYDDLTVSFMNARQFDGDALRCYYSTDYNGFDDPYDGFTWVDITDHFSWSTGDYAWVNTAYNMSTVGMTNLYIAFKYTCSETAAATWEIANFRVYNGWDAVAENNAASFKLYPNPASSVIRIEAEAATTAQIMDMAGRVVMSVNVVEGENAISVAELEGGVYFVRMNGAVVKFIKR